MAEQIDLEVVTPEQAVFRETVDDVVVPGVLGQMDILPGHLPMLAALNVGQMTVRENGKTRHFLIDQGFAEVSEDRVTVLTEACEGVDDIDIEQAKKLLEESQEKLARLEETSRTEVVEEKLFDQHRLALKRQRMRVAFAKDELP